MARIATTTDSTVWSCDNCAALIASKTAFTVPLGWWRANIEYKTKGGERRVGRIDACKKSCLTDAITYRNQDLIREN